MPGLLLLALASCVSENRFRYEEGLAWNTLYHITYESSADLSDSIAIIFNEIDSSLSPFNETSTVSRINRNETDSIDKWFRMVYEESRKINMASDAAFDPTLAPLIRAWGFGQGHEISADTLRLDSLLQFVGINKTKIEGSRLIKEDPRIEFNFSALAKGFGVDQIADMMLRNGVDNFLVEVGGEIRAHGTNPAGESWKIGIDLPSEEAQQGDMACAVSITDCGLATSGNYRNYHVSEGNRFGHTISPIDGRPVKSDVISATVLASDCMEADALATSCMVLGSEKALDLCTGLRAGVLLILEDMTVVSNPIWRAVELGTEVQD